MKIGSNLESRILNSISIICKLKILILFSINIDKCKYNDEPLKYITHHGHTK